MMLTTAQAAARLGLSRSQVAHLASQGRLRGAQKAGRDWLIPAGAIAQYRPGPTGWPAGKARRRSHADVS